MNSFILDANVLNVGRFDVKLLQKISDEDAMGEIIDAMKAFLNAKHANGEDLVKRVPLAHKVVDLAREHAGLPVLNR